MSWHFLVEGAEVSSEAICWDGNQFVPSSEKTTLGAYCLPDNGTESCLGSPSGMTYVHLKGCPGEGGSMSSQADFLARIFPPLAKERASKESSPAFGPRWHELSVKFDPDTSSWKTHRCLFQEDLPWSSVTLPKWGLMHAGVCWERTTPALPTSGTGSGYSLPTPTASSGGTNKSASPGAAVRPTLETMARRGMWPTPNVPNGGRRVSKDAEIRFTGSTPTAYKDGKKQQVGLEQAVAWWPTPVSTDGSHGGRVIPRMWPTPRAASKSGGGIGLDGGSGARNNPNYTPEMGQAGSLNPIWTEWLMGWPLNWTSLDPLPFRMFHEWLRASRTV